MKTNTNTADLGKLADALDRLTQELGSLSQRVAALEAAAAPVVASGTAAATQADGKASTHAPSPSPAEPKDAMGLSEELLLVISAAIAAFVGKKAHIRQIRLIGSAAWAQQGRVTMQASHALSVQSARS